MFDLSGDTGNSFNLIPTGTLAMGIIKVSPHKISNAGGRYYPFEIEVTEGEYASRRIWGNVMDPFFPAGCDEAESLGKPGNSEGAVNMGKGILQRILELNNGASPDKEGSYNIADISDGMSGMKVAVKIKIKPASNGYEAKNEIQAFLSPLDGTPNHADYKKLQAGGGSNPPQASGGFSQAAAFSAPSAPQVQAEPNWLSQANTIQEVDEIPFNQ
tara:strand:+ start:2464 stop:3108 length:645 start_codon:yes stop_codon:yes gene_type:complete